MNFFLRYNESYEFIVLYVDIDVDVMKCRNAYRSIMACLRKR